MTYLSVLNNIRLNNVVAEIRIRGHAFATIHRVRGFVQPGTIGQDAAGTDTFRVVLACGVVCDHAKELFDHSLQMLLIFFLLFFLLLLLLL